MTRALKIFIIEDNDAVREAMSEVLTREGHEVFSVAMAEDVDDEPIGSVSDLYIIDLNLPGEDGISLASRIRRSQPDVGIVIVSARSSVDDRIGGYRSGANIYLTKPISLEELRAVVAGFSNRKWAPDESEERSLSIRPLRMVAMGPTGEVQLTQPELVLLSAFARASQQSLEHWQVAAHLGAGEAISKENLEVKVGRLRKKLIGCGAKPPAILSIRGVGYKLVEPARIETE